MLVRLFMALTIVSAGVQAQSAKQFRTPWGEPDLQGIWNGETLTPLQRPARFANKPVLTPEEADILLFCQHVVRPKCNSFKNPSSVFIPLFYRT